MSVDVQSGLIDIAGGQLFFEVAGSGDWIVLIHGNGGDRRHWDHQFMALAGEFRVVRYDVRGFGRSSLPVEGEAYSDHDDLAALFDHLGVDHAHVAGWSMGCAIAVDFVLAYPARAKSLVAVGPWVFGYASPAAQRFYDDVLQMAAEIARNGVGVAVNAWMKAPFFAATICDPSSGAEFACIASDYSWWPMTHPSPQQILQPGALGRLADIRAATLTMTAEHDIAACQEIAELIEETVPDARRIVMQETGHLLQMEQPEAFNDHIVAFLRSVG